MTWRDQARLDASRRGADLVREVYPRLDPAQLYGSWGWSEQRPDQWSSSRCPHGCSSASGQSPLTVRPSTLHWFCHKCGRGGGPLGWLQLTAGVTAIAARRKLRRMAFPDPGTPAAAKVDSIRIERRAASRRQRRKRKARKLEARALWDISRAVRPGDPAARYLRRRGLAKLPDANTARITPRKRIRALYPRNPRRRLPAACIRAYLLFPLVKPRKSGKLLGVQFESLTKKGRIPKPRFRRTLGPAAKTGMIVRPEGARIVVVEGPLDALAVAEWFPEACAVAMVGGAWSARRLPKLRGRPVTLFPDADAAGKQAAERLIRDMAAAGMPEPMTIGLADASGRDPLDRYVEYKESNRKEDSQ